MRKYPVVDSSCFCYPGSISSLRKGPRFCFWGNNLSIVSVLWFGLHYPHPFPQTPEVDPDWFETNRYLIPLASATDSRTDK